MSDSQKATEGGKPGHDAETEEDTASGGAPEKPDEADSQGNDDPVEGES